MSIVLATLGLPFMACLLMTTVLGYLGLHVLKREVIFIDIAVAQVAALGAVAAHMAFHVHADSPQALACAFGATLVAALFFAVVRQKISQLPIEAAIGITYAIVAAGALFLIGKSTGGHTHVQEMLTGSLLWVGWRDVGWAALAFAFAGVCFRLFRHPFQRISDDYEKAANEGVKVVAWDFVFYALCGIVITVAVHLAGVVVVFCFLIIPATISALFSDKWGVRLFITWLAGTIGSLTGLIFCHVLDFSAGVSVALFLGIILIVSGMWKRLDGSMLRRSFVFVCSAFVMLLDSCSSGSVHLAVAETSPQKTSICETIKDVGARYGFPSPVQKGNKITLKSKYTTMVFEEDSRKLEFNGILIWLNSPVVKEKSQWTISKTDMAKVLDPLLRFDTVLDSAGFRTIVIDPGHGGEDTGAIGRRRVYEKKVVLDIAKRVREKL